ncbi:hypothetical protein BDZ97DRAFT_1759160 [Flammula alnicola]|nr:hypothetical protein BDZ97DRAFT_1759160 [Flammula alnicola]
MQLLRALLPVIAFAVTFGTAALLPEHELERRCLSSGNACFLTNPGLWGGGYAMQFQPIGRHCSRVLCWIPLLRLTANSHAANSNCILYRNGTENMQYEVVMKIRIKM